MAWPDTDVQTYRLALGEAWLFQNDQPPSGWSAQAALGWARSPLYATLDGAERPVVDDLLHVDAGSTVRYGILTGTVDASFRAVWEGPVGVANPRIGAAVTTPRWNVVGHWTLPVSTFDALLAAPTSVLDVSGSYGTPFLRASVTAMLRPDTGPDWRPSAVGSLGIAPIDGWTIEGKAEYLFDSYLRAEVGTRVHHRFGAMDAAVSASTGLTPTVGTPQWRILFSASWAKRPVPEAPIPVPDLPPPVAVAQPAPIEPVVPVPVVEAAPDPIAPAPIAPAPPPDRKYGDVFDAAADFFRTNPSLRFIVETNGTKDQAERVIDELQKRGILKERVVRIDLVRSRGPVSFDFVVVEEAAKTTP